jgi:hypothetical protein
MSLRRAVLFVWCVTLIGASNCARLEEDREPLDAGGKCAGLVGASNCAQAMELSAKETKRAQALYVAKCARCHRIYEPAKYDAKRWQEWMKSMGEKSRLNQEELDLLSRYLDTLRLTNSPIRNPGTNAPAKS